jgi:ubiquinone/menaquinone biosynthesis C-methylase UbiE
MSAQATSPVSVDEGKLDAFMTRILGDAGGAVSSALVILGDRLGLFRSLAQDGPAGSWELARRTETSERMVREWLAAMGASGYLTYDSKTRCYALEPEAAMVFSIEDSPVCLAGFYESVFAMYHAVPKIEAAFRSGKGLGWNEHHQCLFTGTERFFRTSYNHHLVQEWLPALDGVTEKLEKGASVADVGCGHGASTIIMARAFPKSRFQGYDYHQPSIERAREAAAKAGVADRVRFDVAPAQTFPGSGYDLVTFFDCLHDMGDPAGAAAHVFKALARDGTWMVVEPMSHDSVEANFNPVGRLYYSASTMICTPASMAQDVGAALGAQAGKAKLTEVISSGGFTRIRLATSTPFNMVLEARP